MADVMEMATLSPTFHAQQEVLQTVFLLVQLQVEWQITSKLNGLNEARMDSN